MKRSSTDAYLMLSLTKQVFKYVKTDYSVVGHLQNIFTHRVSMIFTTVQGEIRYPHFRGSEC